MTIVLIEFGLGPVLVGQIADLVEGELHPIDCLVEVQKVLLQQARQYATNHVHVFVHSLVEACQEQIHFFGDFTARGFRLESLALIQTIHQRLQVGVLRDKLMEIDEIFASEQVSGSQAAQGFGVNAHVYGQQISEVEDQVEKQFSIVCGRDSDVFELACQSRVESRLQQARQAKLPHHGQLGVEWDAALAQAGFEARAVGLVDSGGDVQ